MNKELVAFDGVSFRRDGRTILKVRWETTRKTVLLGLNDPASPLSSMIPTPTDKRRSSVSGRSFREIGSI